MKDYRADIDGLRAVAVGAVVFFHAYAPRFGGGYLGVDIFFVISGYLITQVLNRRDGSLHMNLRQFYERRLRRIAPALTVVLIGCSTISLFLLSPFELNRFARSLAATTTFASNFFFMRNTNYFAPSLEMPLLHLWSLSVEEQFYVVYPLFVWTINRYSHKHLLPTIVALFVLSLVASEYLAVFYPRIVFYFTGFRVWEFALGAILATLPFRPRMSGALAETFTLIAFLTVLVALWQFDSSPRTLVVHELIICTAVAVMLVIHKDHHTMTSRVLSAKPVVLVGLISYSLYLWHWPIFVFFRRLTLREATPTEYAMLIGISLVAATLSWAFVEQPFRQRRVAKSNLWRAAAASAMSLMFVAIVIQSTGGFPKRFSAPERRIYSYLDYYNSAEFLREFEVNSCFVLSPVATYSFDRCFRISPSRPNIVLWGDSHAMHYFAGLHLLSQTAHLNLIQATFSSCRPIFTNLHGTAACSDFNRRIFARLNRQISAVIISTRLSEQKDLLDALKGAVSAIQRLGIQVVVIGPSLEYQDAEPLYVARFVSTGDRNFLNSATKLRDDLYSFDAVMGKRFTGMKGVSYISVVRSACRSGLCPMIVDGAPTQYDQHHLTAAGSRLLVRALWPQIFPALQIHYRRITKSNIDPSGLENARPGQPAL